MSKIPDSVLSDTRYSRFDTCPSTLTVGEAAHILRVSPDTLHERIKTERRQRDTGDTPPNPIPVQRIGDRILIPARLLQQWQEREAGSSASPTPIRTKNALIAGLEKILLEKEEAI